MNNVQSDELYVIEDHREYGIDYTPPETAIEATYEDLGNGSVKATIPSTDVIPSDATLAVQSEEAGEDKPILAVAKFTHKVTELILPLAEESRARK